MEKYVHWYIYWPNSSLIHECMDSPAVTLYTATESQRLSPFFVISIQNFYAYFLTEFNEKLFEIFS